MQTVRTVLLGNMFILLDKFDHSTINVFPSPPLPRRLLPAGAEDENPFMLFLRSMLPTFNTQMPPNPPAGVSPVSIILL